MTDYKFLSRFENRASGSLNLVAFCVIAAGFFLYLYYASGYYLNPDEGVHFVTAHQRTLKAACFAAGGLAHPPLMIMILHLFLFLGKSVFMLRLFSALFCVGALWFAFKWIQRVYGPVEAIAGLILLTFSPAMISAASEVRQYAMLLFFLYGALYFMRRFQEDGALLSVCMYSIFLYGAILSHYSAILVVLTFAVYMAMHLLSKKQERSVNLYWLASQAGVIVLYLALSMTHIKWMLHSGFAMRQIQGYLKSMYFFSDTENIISFISRNTFKFFAYIAGLPLAGYYEILLFILEILFILGILSLIIKRTAGEEYKEKWFNIFLLVFPFIVGVLAAAFKIMPFGGSRHSIYLLLFAVTAMSLCLVRVFLIQRVTLVMAVAAIVVPIWLSSIHLPNANVHMSDVYMQDFLAKLDKKVPAESVLFVDDMTHYVLAYYLARDELSTEVVRHGTLREKQMGKYRVVLKRSTWSFSPDNFEQGLADLSRFYNLKAGCGVWVATIGWGNSMDFNNFLSDYTPGRIKEHYNFGPIILAKITAP